MGLDPNQDGQITEDEFTNIMKYISIRSNSALPNISGNKKYKPNDSTQDPNDQRSKQQADVTMQIYE